MSKMGMSKMGMSRMQMYNNFLGTMEIRKILQEKDIDNVRSIAASTGFFREDEMEVAVELVQEALARGSDSGYFFLFAEQGGQTLGFACFGPTPCTVGSWDLYWIAVRNEFRGQGIGKRLLAKAEHAVGESGGRKLFIETSSGETYLPTREFYIRSGYQEEARIKDFYRDGDDKLIYSHRITRPTG
jgi:ribosomal protein S18 acetylase RimI-like enzyme